MPFTPVTYNTGAAPGLDGPAFNAMQTQFAAAVNSFERDLFTPFVFSGLTATRDGTTLSQLNVTAGTAFLRQSGSNSELFRQAPTSSTQSTSGHPSTTMYLFLNPDGTWAWQTSSTPPTNALAIAHCTTDASSNILVVTDDRVLGTTLLSGRSGSLEIGKFTADSGAITSDGSGKLTIASMASSGLLTVTRTLSGSIKEFLRMATTDSNTYGFVVDSDGSWKLRNIGSATNILTVDSSGNLSATSLTASGAVAGASVTDNARRVAVQGSHSAGQPIISYGTGVPATLDANEIYIQLS